MFSYVRKKRCFWPKNEDFSKKSVLEVPLKRPYVSSDGTFFSEVL